MEKMIIQSYQNKSSEAKPCVCGHCGKEIGLAILKNVYEFPNSI